MELASIKGDIVLLLYHAAEAEANVGQQFTILERPEGTEGLIVQVISNDSLQYTGLEQEMIQRVLEQQITSESLLDREGGMGEIKRIKLATAKIRKRIQGGTWCAWDGWIPTRNVDISRIEAEDLLGNVLPHPEFPIRSFTRFDGTPVEFDGPRLNMVNVVTGVKGSGKSHTAKHLVIALSERHVPCIIFDINGEYIGLPNAQVLRWGDNFLPDLADFGYDMLRMLIRALYPLQPNSPSESVFETRVSNIFNERQQYSNDRGEQFTIDIPYLRRQAWGGGDFVVRAIDHRLELVERMRLFWSTTEEVQATRLLDIYDGACDGRPIVFDMRNLGTNLQKALVASMNRSIESICNLETNSETFRYPFVFFEEAHFYIDDATILNIITRGRHIGIASFFVTNTPQKLPDTVFRQLDNLFLLGLTHKEDIKNVSKNSFTDEDTIQSFATRMPQHYSLIVGNITDRYPLVLEIDPLPEEMPLTGQTRSTWDRFREEHII